MNIKVKNELQKLIIDGRDKERSRFDEEIDDQLKSIKVNINILSVQLEKGLFDQETEKVIKFLIQDSQETLNTIVKERPKKYISQDILDSRAWNEFYRGGD